MQTTATAPTATPAPLWAPKRAVTTAATQRETLPGGGRPGDGLRSGETRMSFRGAVHGSSLLVMRVTRCNRNIPRALKNMLMMSPVPCDLLRWRLEN